MREEVVRSVTEMLTSHDPAVLTQGLALVRSETPTLDAEGARRVCELILPLFYIDPLDHPEQVPVIEEAIQVVAGLGEPVIPVLIENLEAGDVKAQMAVAQALGWMGDRAIDPLVAEYESTCPDPACRAFLLYALGKVKSPQIVKAAALALDAASSPDVELRDTATRAIGKFAESIPQGALSEEIRSGFRERLIRSLADGSPGVRAKAVRSLGKLAKHGHLSPREKWELAVALRRIMGEDEHFEWDRAYVVRKEAKEALEYV